MCGWLAKQVGGCRTRNEHTVGKRHRRFLKDCCDGAFDEARPGRPRTIKDDQVTAVIERTSRTRPSDATHWSIRSMAAETGFSHTTIRAHVDGVWLAAAPLPNATSFHISAGINRPAAVCEGKAQAGLRSG
jgi:transposase